MIRTKTLALWAAASIAIGCGSDSKPPGDDDGGTFEPEPPASYVAKVKNVLVGLPPSDAEIAAVEADPKALAGLVDGWMALPEYQHKMMVFFELAFQQTQITQIDFVSMIPPNGLTNGAGLPLLVQNARESFARTVLELQAQGAPLTDAFTTRRVMMTPALMALYAFLDARPVDDDGTVRDSFARANPGLRITLQTAGGPVPIAQTLNPASPNYMHWYTPDLPNLKYPDPSCNGLDPITFAPSALLLVQMLYGEIPNHQSPTGNCGNKPGTPASVQFTPADFNTWTMVTIRRPAAGEEITPFYDLATLRTTHDLVLKTPRVGFFSTPAFFANWPTNSSNQHRVTLNQALIVATGGQIDGSDLTSPTTTPGLDADHATDACFGCHSLLDPTRSILSKTYSWFGYPQTEPALIAQPGQFAFQGVIAPMANIGDFGNLLASHPLVSAAWAQKLCYYVNSAPCDPEDPEFLRIVAAFDGSSRSWNTLVRELMTSPITTFAAQTRTSTTNGEVIAVARRDHLCAAIDSRLGLIDICELDATLVSQRRQKPSTIAQIVDGLPSDGYGRGSTVPVLPNQPTLFYRAGLENICAGLAGMVIDAAPIPSQPGAKQWSSAQPDAAIADFVATVMALTPSDERSRPVTGALRSHFDAAVQSGESPTAALRSTFVTACLSPSFIGIGL
jgi:hypothetical protein